MTQLFNDANEWQTLKNGIIALAKQEVLSRFEKVTSTTKADGSVLTEADTEMQKATAAFLQKNWPQFDFLGEESSPEEQAIALKSTQGCWILDPVDGTSNFASGIPIFSVSLALVVNGQVVAGMVYDPDRDEMFAARKNMGAELNHHPLIATTQKTALKKCIGIVDFKRLSPELALKLVQNPPYASQRSIGSVALDWCWIAAGRGQVYCHGAQNIWDYAAGWLIVEEAGGKSATLDGESVLVDRVVKRSAVAATTPELFKEWQSYLA
ncbi:inositol monophosphatase [Hydrogenovibrio sp. 3SP14C1]|uniref:inositol monophosphatase family protein n=1 Tax=Hydrogenovibrio sp. 3SP14C1 TaxID=3038774 RepID=UPI0024179C27|nr:inositol monophosphatase [Hydrogenovibrio sp. 3SP14C1]MDG4812453.1 inositol monophosphatase [Hydrogenovibrio sp. 3SP14C1]